MNQMNQEERRRPVPLTARKRARIFYLLRVRMVIWPMRTGGGSPIMSSHAGSS
jgi:hypothetical protein